MANEIKTEAKPSDFMFTPSVRTAQQELGSSELISRLESRDHWKSTLSDQQLEFIKGRDSFYLGTADKQGKPYIQHRGGHKGFIQLEGNSCLWFPDFSGNQQYISIGNLSENNQAFIFFMDYANKRRLKLWGRAIVLNKESERFKALVVPDQHNVERIIRFEIDVLDENCRQHIPTRYSEVELSQQLALLSTENLLLKNKVNQLELALKKFGE